MANKHLAAEEIQIRENPVLEKDEAPKLASWLKPIRWALINGDGANGYAGKLFQGWMGPSTFYGMVAQKVPNYKRSDLIKAMSIVQFPPVTESPSEVI